MKKDKYRNGGVVKKKKAFGEESEFSVMERIFGSDEDKKKAKKAALKSYKYKKGY